MQSSFSKTCNVILAVNKQTTVQSIAATQDNAIIINKSQSYGKMHASTRYPEYAVVITHKFSKPTWDPSIFGERPREICYVIRYIPQKLNIGKNREDDPKQSSSVAQCGAKQLELLVHGQFQAPKSRQGLEGLQATTMLDLFPRKWYVSMTVERVLERENEHVPKWMDGWMDE